MPVAHDVLLTRYMRFASFESAITHGLFIPKATLFDDRFEGVLHYFNADPATAPMSRDEIRRCLEWVYVSCWYSRSPESHAMWRIYGGRDDEAIAIQTSPRQLRSACESLRAMHTNFGAVQYEEPGPNLAKKVAESIEKLWDAGTPGLTIYAALFSFAKHVGYQFEHEVRLVAVDPSAQVGQVNEKSGVRLEPIATREMIRSVILGPRAPDWLFDLTRDLCSRHGLHSAVIRRSSLDLDSVD
jgi:hypothetical protein